MEQVSERDLQQNSAWIPLRQKVVAAMQWQRPCNSEGSKSVWKCKICDYLVTFMVLLYETCLSPSEAVSENTVPCFLAD